MPAIPDRPSAKSRVALVVGADGFLGGFIVAALRARGWRVLRGVRQLNGADDERCTDLARMHAPQDWQAALANVELVVNAAGILRECGAQTFAAIHVEGPLAMTKACIEAGIPRLIQISALGVAADGDFIASKLRFDELLVALDPQALVLRPSVVYSSAGSYGGTSLLRALAALPGVVVLPGDGRWLLQPIAAEDLGILVVRAAEGDQRGIYQVGGPQPMSLREYQTLWRQWLRIPGQVAFSVPEWLVSIQAWLGERLGRGPVGETMWRMLRRGNLPEAGALDRLREDFDFVPRTLQAALAQRPSQVQDRWQARLYLLAPVLRMAIVLVWLLSAVAGWSAPADAIAALSAESAMHNWPVVMLARTTAVLDFILAAWLASGWRPRWALALMALSVLAYTLVFGCLVPALWLEPLGGLVKNLMILPALAVAWVLAERR